MPPFRPPQARIDALSELILRELQQNSALSVQNPAEAKALFRAMLTENLREEHDLELEAEAMVRAHGQKIYEQKADFQTMIHEGKKILAKKKNFTL